MLRSWFVGSQHCFRAASHANAEDFLDRCDTLAGFGDAVLALGDHAGVNRLFPEFIEMDILGDGHPYRIVHLQQFVNADPAAITELLAVLAALAAEGLDPSLSFQRLPDPVGGLAFFAAVGADLPD